MVKEGRVTVVRIKSTSEPVLFQLDQGRGKSSITTERVGTPDRVTTPPGEVLAEEFLRPLGLSVHAAGAGVTRSRDPGKKKLPDQDKVGSRRDDRARYSTASGLKERGNSGI